MRVKVFKDPQVSQRTWDLNGKDLTQATIHYIELTQYEKFTIVFHRVSRQIEFQNGNTNCDTKLLQENYVNIKDHLL